MHHACTFFVQADSYWSLNTLLDGIQDNYIASQPGIQTRIAALSELVNRVDGALHKHLKEQCIESVNLKL